MGWVLKTEECGLWSFPCQKLSNTKTNTKALGDNAIIANLANDKLKKKHDHVAGVCIRYNAL